jgi:hypothetical protein
VARWIELLLLLSLLQGGGGQASLPGLPYSAPDAPRAVLLEEADLYAEPSTAGEMIGRLPAGTVLQYASETTDAFGRTWYGVRDPDRVVRRRDAYLVPFGWDRYRAYGYRGALLADRRALPAGGAGGALAPGAAATVPASAAGEKQQPWWRPVATLQLGNTPTFGEPVGISATTPDEGQLRQAIELLGGLDAIANWPADPEPGELFVPDLLPALFEYDGTAWDLARPVRLLGEAVSLIGNGRLLVDAEAPPLAGGPALYCWQLINALDPRGELSGSLAVAPAPTAEQRGGPPPRDMGPFSGGQVPGRLRGLLPPAPDSTRVPLRVDPPPIAGGVLLADNDGRQAVFIEQRLGRALTARLRGRALVLDVVARDDPRAGAATFGIDVEVSYADERPAQHFPTSFTSRAVARRDEWAFELPDDADDVVIRLLPLDRELAVEQQGSVIFDRVGLRLADWDPDPPPAAVVLYRVNSFTYEGAPRYTRAPIALTERNGDDLRRAWQKVAATDWSIDDKKLVLAGQLRRGMSREQVSAGWGDPAEETTQPDGSIELRWADDDRYVLLADGHVIASRPPTHIDLSDVPLMCPAR